MHYCGFRLEEASKMRAIKNRTYYNFLRVIEDLEQGKEI